MNDALVAHKGRQRQSIIGTPWLYSNDSTKALTVEEPIFQGGATLAQMREAREKVKAGREQLLAAEQQVLLSAVRTWKADGTALSLAQDSPGFIDDLRLLGFTPETLLNGAQPQ